jgi:hypothetical protein
MANDAQTQFSGLGARAPRPVAGPVSLPGFALTPSPMTRPIRAAFYYPWFPQTWGNIDDPFTQYHPTAGYYSSDDTALIAKHVAAMRYGHLDAAISSWWGQGQQRENTRFPAQLSAANGTGFTWTLYYEKEGFGDPSSSELSGDLSYIKNRYAGNVNYLKINGRPVIFVYGGAEACSMVDRWKAANTFGFYIVLKVFGGYGSCANQPDNWHQYGPAVAVDIQAGRSFVISPGFHLKGESTPRLARDPNRFAQNVADMIASNAPLQLVSTFNEWGEGTAVESATEWASPSGYGVYLDILHTAYRRRARLRDEQFAECRRVGKPVEDGRLDAAIGARRQRGIVSANPAQGTSQPPWPHPRRRAHADSSRRPVTSGETRACSTADRFIHGWQSSSSYHRTIWLVDDDHTRERRHHRAGLDSVTHSSVASDSE